ncbi:helix-turn-helix domain-containing protein [Streptomyces sp. NPDC052052]|uniref:helix-turn-helix domain-containing protein n=1 Tax=Streptomyces sp. NPDC052052 TaxID=3154756 RepID=UPI00342F10DE
MAITSLTPYSAPSDLMNLKEICELLKGTGHPFSQSTVRRWIEQEEIPVQHWGRKRVLYVSYSDILMAHRKAVAQREG